jgi:diguanylate cyclase (GGDEF)-like protein
MSKNVKILVVDDDKFNVTLMRELCETTGYEVIEAHDGNEALDLARSESPDLMLLDIMMGGKNGFDVCRELRSAEDYSDLPIIIVTALDDIDSKMRGLEMGADDYVTKPFRLFELQQRIRTVLEAKLYKQQLREAREKLIKLGEIDSPGRIGGYRQLRSGLEYEFQRAQRYEHSLACALFSLTDYDSIYDERGRKEAASLIGALVTVLQKTLRSVDRIYRLDNDEFLLLLPETASAGAHRAIERIREALTSVTGSKSTTTVNMTAALVSYPHPEIKTGQDLLWKVNELHKVQRQDEGKWLIEL